jgi:hypothetical protein
VGRGWFKRGTNVSKTTRWILTIAAAVATGCLLAGIVAGLITVYGGLSRSAWGPPFGWLTTRPITGPEGLRGYSFEGRSYTSNGERIYYTVSMNRDSVSPLRAGPCGCTCTVVVASVATARAGGVAYR